jgi:hypothetical protein
LEWARERMEGELSVAKTARELWGTSGSALLQAMPGQAAPTWRGAPGCKGSGRCAQGCPHKAKASADVTLLPSAERSGARIYARCQVERVVLENGVATGILGRFDSGKRMQARARRAVIVAASAIQTPWLLLRSGVKDVGTGFMVQPTAVVAGLFHRPIDDVAGATQAMESHAFRAEGMELHSIRLPAALRAAHVPGVGAVLDERMAALDHVAVWSVTVRAEARGRVRRGPFGPVVNYAATTNDRRKLLHGMSILSEALLRAGALEVWPGVYGAPDTLTTLKQAVDLAQVKPRPGLTRLHATQFFGGVPVDDRFQAHGLSRLVIADSSLFPSNIGVKPMSTIMAVASLVAERWIG